MKRYAVSEKGSILGHFDTRIKDGCRLCVDYRGEITGELCHDSEKIEEFDTLEKAVTFSRKIRIDILKKQHEAALNMILNEL
mgnify:CR=1 FL=1